MAGLWTAAVGIFGALLGMARLPRPRVTPEASSRFRAGSASEVPPGTAKVLPAHQVQLVSTAEGIAALSLVCTHLGCIVQQSEAGFVCPCHGSSFSPDGEVRGGPAPRALRWLEVSQAADGALVVDTDREVEPGTYYRVQG